MSNTMSNTATPEKLQDFIYSLTKEVARSSFEEWREHNGISYEQYIEIKEWFKQFEIEPYV